MNQPGRGREGGMPMKFHAIGDSRPPHTLLKQEGLQLAASFRDHPVPQNSLFDESNGYLIPKNGAFVNP